LIYNVQTQLEKELEMNAKDELLKAVGRTGAKVLCATIQHGDDTYRAEDEQRAPVFNLRKGYTFDDWRKFLRGLNFVYDSGYGGQELFGIVWLDDGTWLERGEYDGSEWWVCRKVPSVPSELAGA